MQYLFMALFAAGAVALDQFTKIWVVNHIASTTCYNYEHCVVHMEKIRGIFHLTEQEIAAMPHSLDGINGVFRISHIHNEGASFSSFQGMRWLFLLIFAVFLVAIIWEFWKKKLPFTKFERWCVVAIFAGGLGNTIDRIYLGYVVDMIDLEFSAGWLSWLNSFAIFNVADCFITCGAIALLVSLIFFNKEFWKDEKKK